LIPEAIAARDFRAPFVVEYQDILLDDKRSLHREVNRHRGGPLTFAMKPSREEGSSKKCGDNGAPPLTLFLDNPLHGYQGGCYLIFTNINSKKM
jgi:hypothetical protein